jgi:hypothetical protein
VQAVVGFAMGVGAATFLVWFRTAFSDALTAANSSPIWSSVELTGGNDGNSWLVVVVDMFIV